MNENIIINGTNYDFSNIIVPNTGGLAGFCNITENCVYEVQRQIIDQFWNRNIFFIYAVVFAVFLQAATDILRKLKDKNEKYNAAFLIVYLINYGVGLYITYWSLHILINLIF